MQQCVYQMMFRNVCKVKKWLLENWSTTLSTAVNKWRKHLLACVCIVGQHFKQFYYRQLKNGQLNEMSAKVSEMWTKFVLRVMLIKRSYCIGEENDILLVVFSPGSAERLLGRWETKLYFDRKLCLEYLYQKLWKSDNRFSSCLLYTSPSPRD